MFKQVFIQFIEGEGFTRLLQSDTVVRRLAQALSVSVDMRSFIQEQCRSLPLASREELEHLQGEIARLRDQIDALQSQLEAQVRRSTKADESLDESLDESIDESLDESIDESIDESLDESLDESIDEPGWSTQDSKQTLLQLARDRGLPARSAMRKAEIVALLEESDAAR